MSSSNTFKGGIGGINDGKIPTKESQNSKRTTFKVSASMFKG